MKKNLCVSLVLVIFVTGGIFAQQVEKLTYEELRYDGNHRTVTVEVYFLAWMQKQFFLEGRNQVTYEAVCPLNGEWSAWELGERSPTYFSSLREIYDALQQQYELHPKGARKNYLNGTEILSIPSIPNGKTSPFWWHTSGNSFYAFYKIYVIKP